MLRRTGIGWSLEVLCVRTQVSTHGGDSVPIQVGAFSSPLFFPSLKEKCRRGGVTQVDRR